GGNQRQDPPHTRRQRPDCPKSMGAMGVGDDGGVISGGHSGTPPTVTAFRKTISPPARDAIQRGEKLSPGEKIVHGCWRIPHNAASICDRMSQIQQGWLDGAFRSSVRYPPAGAPVRPSPGKLPP